MARRRLNVFGLAFLDAMMCGFGAAVLLYMVINAAAGVRAGDLTGELRAEANRLETEVLEGVQNLVELRNSVDEVTREQVTAAGLSRRMIEVLRELEVELATFDSTTIAERESLNKLKADLKSLEEGAKRLSASVPSEETPGERVRAFVGDGDRQYLTGLRVGGDRVFLLLDASSSMLAETIVNVIRRRNLPDSDKVRAAKWQRALDTVDWLSTQIPRDSRFQLYTFAEEAAAVVEGSAGDWLDGGDPEVLGAAVGAARRVVPRGGTNLLRAFEAVAAMRPAPDNVTLITDGLPTLGRGSSKGRTITGKERLRLFNRALEVLPKRIPVNVILMPIEGDPMAASAFWQLAMATRGSFLAPSEDWP